MNPVDFPEANNVHCLNCERLKDKLAELDRQLYLSKNQMETHLQAWKANNSWHAAQIARLKAVMESTREIFDFALKDDPAAYIVNESDKL